jgi:carbon monoxide dehydrogenase subunit G
VAVARAEVTIGRPADVVWARIRDFGDITWIPNTESCRMEGDVRFIRMHGVAFEVIEQLLGHDDSERSCSYFLVNPEDLASVTGPGNDVTGLEATLRVTEQGEATLVTWDIDTDAFLIGSVQDEYQAALDNLQTLLEESPRGKVQP